MKDFLLEIIIVTVLLMVVAAVFINAPNPQAERKKCEAKQGVMVHTDEGNLCVKLERIM